MTDWRKHLLPHEAARLEELDEQADAARKERRRIWDRCRKRARTKGALESGSAKAPKNPIKSKPSE